MDYAEYVLEKKQARVKYLELLNHHGKRRYMDPIANMITSINNSIKLDKKNLIIPYSKQKIKILSKLMQYQYISSIKESNKDNKKTIIINLNYNDGKSAIEHLKRLSKPSLRRYVNSKQIPVILGGVGDVLISTSQGIYMGKEAKKKNIGGELICEVY